MKDSCRTKENILGEVAVPCFERHDPQKVSDEDALETLKSICPSLFRTSSGEEISDPFVCCSSTQIYEMETNFQFPAQMGLSRCPSCSYNFRTVLCEMTCNPRQAEFLRVVNTSLAEDGFRQQIDNVEYHLDASFPEKLHDSCKGVQGLAPGQMLLDLMCGPWGSKECTGRKWLSFIGESIEDNGQSPFGVNYVFHEVPKKESGRVKVQEKDYESGSLHPLSPSSFSCYERPSPKDLSCSCNDCEETCRRKQLPAEAKFLPEDIESIEVMGMTGGIFSSLLMFLFLVSLILTYFLVNAYQKKRTQNRK
jgi:Niemann-Pick C1 protein